MAQVHLNAAITRATVMPSHVKPALHLANPRADDVLSRLILLFTALTGREPTDEEIDECRAMLAESEVDLAP